MLSDLMENPTGQMLVSILLGFGLATLFRKVCTGKNCVVVEGPALSDINKYYYKIDESCYKYTPYQTSCDS